jgi:hypothetical protein
VIVVASLLTLILRYETKNEKEELSLNGANRVKEKESY